MLVENSFKMGNHVWTRFIYTIALCISVRCLHPITKELTAVTNPWELDKIFSKFHPDELPTPRQSKSEKKVGGIDLAQAEVDTSTIDSDSPETSPPPLSAGTSTSNAPTMDDAPGTSTQTSHHDETVLTAAVKEEICEHIASSGFFILNHMFHYSPTKHVRSLYKNNPNLANHFFKIRILDKDGIGRHLLPRPTLANPSEGHRIYVEGRKRPIVENMFSCLLIQGVIAGTIRRFYVSDRQYNLSKDPRKFIAGRFLAMREASDKKLKLMALAEQAATLEAIDLKKGAALFASLKDKHKHPQMKYSIARLSPGETIRLCASIMSALRRDFQKDLLFLPTLSKISTYQPQQIRALEVKEAGEEEKSLHFNTGGSMASIVCTGKDGETYYVLQGDEQDAVFVANEMTYQTEIVRYFASGIALLTEAAAAPALEENSE